MKKLWFRAMLVCLLLCAMALPVCAVSSDPPELGPAPVSEAPEGDAPLLRASPDTPMLGAGSREAIIAARYAYSRLTYTERYAAVPSVSAPYAPARSRTTIWRRASPT